VVLELGMAADYNRVRIAAVVSLHREPPASPERRLAETRTGRQFADPASVRSGQRREAQRKSLVERAA
jgi:hypothetical protein